MFVIKCSKWIPLCNSKIIFIWFILKYAQFFVSVYFNGGFARDFGSGVFISYLSFALLYDIYDILSDTEDVSI